MATEDLPSLDLLVLFDDHHETFSTHTSPEATGMTRITFALATALSLAFTPVAAQNTVCDAWVSPDWEVRQVFWEAATTETVSGCLNSGSDVNAKIGPESTPLHYAAQSYENPDVLSIIAVLLDAGADINARNQAGYTPLNWGAGNPEVLTLLLGAGANVNDTSEGDRADVAWPIRFLRNHLSTRI